jgi:acyl-coenzyme A synthetase/AMP-(fatty) acid ligase
MYQDVIPLEFCARGKKVKIIANACARFAVKDNKVSMWYPFANSVALYPTTTAIWSRERVYTFAEAQDQAARYAQWILSEGIRPGELVAMYLTNSAEFLIIWLAVLSIGCSPAFLNYNLEGKALLHCLDVCETKLVIVDDDAGCRARIQGVRGEIEKKGKKVVFLDDALQQQISATKAIIPGDEYRKGVNGEFPSCLIYTRYVLEAVTSITTSL